MFEGLKRNKYVVRYRRDYEWRTVVRTAFSSLATLAVGTHHLLMAFIVSENPTWLFVLAAYYYALAVARVTILLSHRMGLRRRENAGEKQLRDAKNYLFGGALLVLLTLIYTGIIVLVTVEGYHYDCPGNFIYFMAIYAFWKVTSSVVQAVRCRRYGDYTVRTMQNINLADGIVSVVALQSALLFVFADAGQAGFAFVMNATVGGIAGVMLFGLGLEMIIGGMRRVQRLKAAQAA